MRCSSAFTQGLLALVVLTLGCSSQKDEPETSLKDILTVDANVGTDTEVCVNTAQKVPSPPILVDANDDGRMDEVEIFEADGYEYPILARWKNHPASRPRDAVWAVATHAVVTLRAEATPALLKAAFSQRLGRQDLDIVPLANGRSFLIGISPGKPGFDSFGKRGELMSALEDLRDMSAGIAEIEPDYLFFPDKKPNDPKFKLSQNEFPPIRALEAWDVQTGSTEVRVAVLDSGIERGHRSLQDSSVLVVHGPPFADLVHGDDDPEDELDHGTYCSALVGAKGNDKKGMTGVNWDVTLMPVKFIDGKGCGTSARAADAVDYAIRNGAHVISASWGGLGNSKALRDAIDRANSAGILFVASAGNTGLDLDNDDYFPASYNLPNMIVVGACDDQGSKVGSSGHGLRNVHLSAPGDKVFSAVRTNIKTASGPTTRIFPYSEPGGTSPAVAFVSGAVALVQAENLKKPVAQRLTPRQIRCRILQSTTRIPALVNANASCSGGRLNLENAVTGRNLRNVCGCP